MSDEIEDEAAEDMTEEDLIAEEEIVISTVAVGEGGGNTSNCPVCREEFDQFYKQGDGLEEGGWYLHNAIRHDDVLYHPECHKDMEKTSLVDTSVDTTTEAMDTTETEEKVEVEGVQEHVGEILEKVKEEEHDQNVKIEVAENDSEKVESTVESMEVEPHDIKEEQEKELKPTDDNDNNVEVKEGVDGEVEESVEEVKEVEEEHGSANNSLLADGAESGANSLSAPVVAQQKVEIKMKINSSMVPFERRESMMSSQSEAEETEFDADAIIVPAPSEDVLESQKPKLKGKKFCVMPPRNLDSDLSGLCSIM